MPALLKTNETSFRSAMSSRLKLKTSATLRGEVRMPANKQGAVASFDAVRRKDGAMDESSDRVQVTGFVSQDNNALLLLLFCVGFEAGRLPQELLQSRSS